MPQDIATHRGDIIVGIDAGTSVMKAVAFDLRGRQLGIASERNRYLIGADGSAVQSPDQTWADCAAALRGLGAQISRFADRVAAVAVTGQGDGTWLADNHDNPVGDAWLWLDGRATPTVERLSAGPDERARFAATGTGLNTCQQGSQMAHMLAHQPELLEKAAVALHCKDWLFLKLTGIRATDPSEASFTFGDFRSRAYSDTVLETLGLGTYRHLLPPIIDGSQETRPLSAAAAQLTGLRAGTPVALGYVDMVMTALGAGVYSGGTGHACSTIGSTGVHLRAVRAEDVHLNAEGTGYVICLPIPGVVTQVQTNMAATLNIDWALDLARDFLVEFGPAPDRAALVARIDGWMARSTPGALVYHPYILEAGERGPFLDGHARASLIGLNASHRFADVIRAVIEGLGMAARDCYAAMGDMPGEVRLTGGAARSTALRRVLGASLGARLRISEREEAGAAGCAMMAAVAIGVYPDMDTCIAEWVTPLLSEPEAPDTALCPVYDDLFAAYRMSRQALSPVWHRMARGSAQ